MNAPLTSAVAIQLDHSIRVLAQTQADLTAVTRLSHRQVWTAEELCDRYSVSKEQLAALLAHHCGYQGARGVAIRVHLDHVLVLDRAMRAALTGAKA
jgi:hypothetical protein